MVHHRCRIFEGAADAIKSGQRRGGCWGALQDQQGFIGVGDPRLQGGIEPHIFGRGPLIALFVRQEPCDLALYRIDGIGPSDTQFGFAARYGFLPILEKPVIG